MKRLMHAPFDTLVPHERNGYRPYLLRKAGIAIALLVFAGAALSTIVYRAALSGSDYLASVLPGVLADLANADRADNALAALTTNPLLVKAAELKAADMAAKGYFAHVSPDGKEPWYFFNEVGYAFVYAGENLAVNFDDSAVVNAAWMNSPAHRANILGNHYTEIGIATAEGRYEGKDVTFVVEEFGSPAASGEQATAAPLVASPAPAAATSSAPREENLVAIENAVPAVSGASVVSGAANYVAVKDENAVPEPASSTVEMRGVSSAPAPRAAPADRLLSSPSHLLEIAYAVFSAFLLVALVAVAIVPHEHQKRHFSRIGLLLVALMILFVIVGYGIFSEGYVL